MLYDVYDIDCSVSATRQLKLVSVVEVTYI